MVYPRVNHGTKIRYKSNQKAQSDYMGEVEVEYSFSSYEPHIKMSEDQISMVKEIARNHFGDSRYIVTYWSIFTSKNFVGVAIWYFPKDAKNTVYCTSRKNIYIGRKGGIQKMTTIFGMGKETNMIPRYRHIARKYAVDPESC